MHKNVRDALCAVALLGCAYGLLMIAKEFSKFSDKPGIGDLATWFGAIGTIGTLIGTIVLATQETRRRNREIRSKARIIIPGLMMKLIAAGKAFDETIQRLDSSRLPNKQILEREAANLRAFSLWTAEDAAALAHLPNDVSSQLMLIKETTETVANSLGFSQNNWLKLSIESVQRLKDGKSLISAVSQECDIEYHRKGDF